MVLLRTRLTYAQINYAWLAGQVVRVNWQLEGPMYNYLIVFPLVLSAFMEKNILYPRIAKTRLKIEKKSVAKGHARTQTSFVMTSNKADLAVKK